MFGQQGNQPFSFNPTAQSSPFSQNSFGKTAASTSFGTNAATVFGNNTLFSAKPAVSNTGGLFGSNTTNTAFGATSATQQPSFGGFGASTTSNVPLFGAQPTQTSNNLFGQTNVASTGFGQVNKPSTFGFGQTSNVGLFGQPQQTTVQQTAPFGQQNVSANTSLFGQTTSGFGAVNQVNNVQGTVIKFNPVSGQDTMVKNGQQQTISTRHHCITCMKEYEGKSLEELRLEDYTAGRKGGAQGSAGMFSTSTQSTPFGAVASTSNTTSTFGAIGTGFGNLNQTTSSNLFSKPVTGFGAPATTTSTFAFNTSTPATNIFSNNQPKAFGSTAAPTSLFSSSNSIFTPAASNNIFSNVGSTPNTGFGTGFNAGQANQSIGLFQQNKPAFNIPASTTTTFGFGQPQTTNTGGGLFGAKPAATSFATGFGATSTPSFQAGTNTFGAAANTNTSLLNSTFKPMGQTGGFNFGNTAATTSTGFGATGTSFFNTSAKPNLFGNTSTTPGSLLGSYGANTSFGNTFNTANSMGGSSMFGQNVYNNSIQQASGTVPVHQQILALVSAPFGDSPLLKNLLPVSGKSEQIVKPSSAISARATNSNYKVVTGDSGKKPKPKMLAAVPFSQRTLFDGLEDEDPLTEAFQPRANSKRLILRLRSNIANNSYSENNEDAENNRSYKVGEQVTEIVDKENVAHSDQQTASTSWLKSSLPNDTRIIDGQLTTGYSDKLSSRIELENTIAELRVPVAVKNDNTPTKANTSKTNSSANESQKVSTSFSKDELSLASNESRLDNTDLMRSSPETEGVDNLANVKLTRYGYYIIPSLENLGDYVREGTCIIPNLTIGRKGYGNVYFADSFDIYGLDLDEIVHFRHKEVIIYPDDTMKPPVGEGLNRKAQITLDRVWPTDKTTHDPITDPNRLKEMDYEAKLRRVCSKHNTRFLEYRPETGSWVFRVDHFSKYGLSDSDDDEVDEKAKNLSNGNILDKKSKSFTKFEKDKLLMSKGSFETTTLDDSQISLYDFQKNKMNFLDECEKSKLLTDSSTTMHARLIGTESRTLQLMKACFFEDDIEIPQSLPQSGITSEKLQKLKKLNISHDNSMIFHSPSKVAKNMNESKLPVESPLDKSIKQDVAKKVANADFQLDPIVPKVAVLRFKPGYVLMRNLFVQGDAFKQIADMGVQRGKIHKPSWGPNSNLIMLKSETIPLPRKDSELRMKYNGVWTNIVQQLNISEIAIDSDSLDLFKRTIETHMNIQLRYSVHKFVQDYPFPHFSSDSTGSDALSEHTAFSVKLSQEIGDDSHRADGMIAYFVDVWRLCESLWGKIPQSNATEDDSSYALDIARKDALSSWLKELIVDTMNNEISVNRSQEQIMFSLLNAWNLEDACTKALKNGDHSLALLISQLGGSSSTSELLKQQINLWRDTEIDRHVSTDRLKILMLIAGLSDINAKSTSLNIYEDLDWKRALAINLWFLTISTSTISDALDQYKNAFSESLDNIQPYNDSTNSYDLCYHLLQLYCSGSYPLEQIFNPITYTSNSLDYRLSWLLLKVLKSLGYSHLSEHVEIQIHNNFASQLEMLNLWQWAVFVVLHIQDHNQRQKAVIDLLQRHVKLGNTVDYNEEEAFLVEKLKIPGKWIYKAKAIKANLMKRYGEAAWYFIEAEEWNQAHQIIMAHLAMDAIINEDYTYLKALLEPLLPTNNSNSIVGWSYQGQLIWDYITIITEVQILLKNKDTTNISDKLEQLRPQLTSLCTKINNFPDVTIKQRVCQSEMAKRTLQVARTILMMHPEDKTNMFLVDLISQLPLPEDYAQQELRPMFSTFFEGK